MAGASAGLAARADLAAVGDEAAQDVHALVVDTLVLLGAELADADAAGHSPAAILAFVFSPIVVAAGAAFLIHCLLRFCHVGVRVNGPTKKEIRLLRPRARAARCSWRFRRR